MTFLERTKCPYCAASLNFARLPVVATTNANDGKRTAAGSAIQGWVGQWPVIREPAADATGMQRFRRFMNDGVALGPAADLPAYVCLRCRHPLPNELATREVYTIAVVGTLGAGKSHFLAAMAREATRRQGLAPFGIIEFAPEELSARTYHLEYYRPIFRERKVLDATGRDEQVQFQPLTFRMTAGRVNGNGSHDHGDVRQMLLMFHDVAGEVLTDRTDRNALAPFVRRADGLIFLVDPAALEPVSDWREREGLSDVPDDFHQADLLRACLNDIGPDRLPDVPIAVTLSKSDVVTKMLGRDFAFSRPASADPARWLAERNYINTEVATLLSRLDATDILAAAKIAPRLTFHAMAPIGSEPMADNTIAEVRPLRVLDPVAQILLTLLNP